ncbi:MAG: SRPBCC domain-containing protein [Bacteroidota bacterium]
MAKTITQKIVFKNQQATELYKMFLDSKLHSQITGGEEAKITAKEGAKYSAHGGYCFGKSLQLIKGKLIVQSWRASDWSNEEMDSTFILSFKQQGKNALLTMVHANVPDNQATSLKSGWADFYWKPWKAFLSK